MSLQNTVRRIRTPTTKKPDLAVRSGFEFFQNRLAAGVVNLRPFIGTVVGYSMSLSRSFMIAAVPSLSSLPFAKAWFD